jgi:hypothetical protein
VPDMRNYYNIESLWQDAKQTEIPNLDWQRYGTTESWQE